MPIQHPPNPYRTSVIENIRTAPVAGLTGTDGCVERHQIPLEAMQKEGLQKQQGGCPLAGLPG